MSSPPAERPRTDSLFAAYHPLARLYDESLITGRILRPYWEGLAARLDKLGGQELSARAENARRIVREHGVTYNIYSDPRGVDHPWELDIIPLLISPTEWRALERGLAQRTTLLNLILTDLYGSQDLLRSGALPPALVFGNPAFLRACHGIRPPKDVYLHLHGIDLARSPSGEWWVLADRTQAPSGTGYALENRIVIARVLPEEYRQAQAHRLAAFFARQCEALRSLAPGGSDNPHIVLLTPGPHNETYFEHAYLARYLGFTLVEGGDLTVRDSRVFLKTLEGLQKVDVILRRVDDTFCDPLELRGDSFLGVAGLVQAARAGNVTLANALGSSIVESPAFLAFLPTLCKTLLGEDLLIPGVATWWCGQGQEQKYVLEHLDEIVVKPAFGRVSQLPFFGGELSARAREKLANDIRNRPHDYVGQEKVAFSTAPAWIGEKLEPRGVAVRFFAASTGETYSIMPGGLSRISSQAGDPVLSMQSGGGTKDTWVLSDEPVAPVTLLTPSGQPASTNRISTELPSRVADNLFWLGRYSERLEGTLRLLRCVLGRMSGENSSEAGAELQALIEILALTERLPRRDADKSPACDTESEVLQLVYSADRVGSVRELVLRLRQIASTVRDRLSEDTWRILNRLQLDSKSRAGRIPLANALGVCNTLIVDLAAFSGMEMENMTRGHGWRFLDLGRRLERAANLVDTIRAALVVNSGSSALLSLLEYADSAITFRRRYFSEPRLPSVLDLLLNDHGNPRSLGFQLNAMRDHARHLPKAQLHGSAEPLAPRVQTLVTRTGEFSLTHLDSVPVESLKSFLLNVASELTALADEITEQHFCHTISQRVESHG
ncbi:MAG TPA: circularly permuted type 2 ATP-grasp protein [Verrucomicrobiae bacterium]|nr:circularly permuted type 2 ATP-grasp protein [Verrucomicrobiae bacterium]